MKYEKKDDNQFIVYYENGARLGEILREVDGYFYFFPEPMGGFWQSHGMREIADKMDEMNKPWDQEIDLYFRNNPANP